MSKKEQIFSPIKKRILQYIEYLGITKREFYLRTGISRGTIDNAAGITEDTLTKLLATYKNINLVWLMTGNGNMTNGVGEESAPADIFQEPKVGYVPVEYKDLIDDLRKTIELLNGQLEESKKDRELLRKLLAEKNSR